MARNDVDSEQHPGGRSYTFQMIFSGAAFLGVLLLTFYLGNEFKLLEHQLRYLPPAIQSSAVRDAGEIDIIEGQTVYVPAYSHIYARGGEPHLLEVTLSIRNTDPTRGIRLGSVRYFDTRGNLVKGYLNGGLDLGPMETVEFLVDKQDTRGGSGANFIVTWDAEEPVYEPIIEAVMIGLTKDHSISFVSPARPLAKRTE